LPIVAVVEVSGLFVRAISSSTDTGVISISLLDMALLRA